MITKCIALLDMYESTDEQIRKHKKKRINKKWIKRYGYKTDIKLFTENQVYPCYPLNEGGYLIINELAEHMEFINSKNVRKCFKFINDGK